MIHIVRAFEVGKRVFRPGMEKELEASGLNVRKYEGLGLVKIDKPVKIAASIGRTAELDRMTWAELLEAAKALGVPSHGMKRAVLQPMIVAAEIEAAEQRKREEEAQKQEQEPGTPEED